MDEVEELLASLGVVTEHSQHGRGHGLAVDLLDTSHDHAHVNSLNDDRYSSGAHGLGHSQGDLLGETLLHLQTAGVDLHNPGGRGERGLVTNISKIIIKWG